MNEVMVIGGAANLAIGLISLGLAIPLALRKVGINNWYGVRTRRSYRSEENWKKINAHYGAGMILWSSIVTLVGLAMVLLGIFAPAILPGSCGYWLNLSLLLLIIPPAHTLMWSRCLD